MKIPITTIFLVFWSIAVFAQKVRLEGDDSQYLCLNDSIAETFEMSLKKDKIDSTISILYDYDNGRLPNSRRIIIWTHNGSSKIRLIEGCDKISKDITYVSNLTNLWNYIKTTHFDDVSVPIKSGTGQSHDRFYHITLNMPGKSFLIVVRDNERKISNESYIPEADTRVILTNKIDGLLTEHYSQQ